MKPNLSAIAILASVWNVKVTAQDCELPPYTAQLEASVPEIRDLYCSLPEPIQGFVEFSVQEAILIDYPTFEFVQTCFGSVLEAFQYYLAGVIPTCDDGLAHINPMHTVVDAENESDVSVTNWDPTFCIPDTCGSDALKTYLGSIFIESNKVFKPNDVLNTYIATESFLPTVECVDNYFQFQRDPQAVCADPAPQCADISFFDVAIASDKSFSQPICLDGCLEEGSRVTETEMNRILALRGNGYKGRGENPYCVSESDIVQVERSEKQPVFDSGTHCTYVQLNKRLGRCDKCRDDPIYNCERFDSRKKKMRFCPKSFVNNPCARTCGKCCHSDKDYKFAYNGKKKECSFIKNNGRKRKYCIGLTKWRCGNECGCNDFTKN